jgi:hypothetical protein
MRNYLNSLYIPLQDHIPQVSSHMSHHILSQMFYQDMDQNNYLHSGQGDKVLKMKYLLYVTKALTAVACKVVSF